MENDSDVTSHCPQCGYEGRPILNEDTGEYVCPQCGYVFPWVGFERTPPLLRDRERGRVHYEVHRGASTTPPQIAERYKRGARRVESSGKDQQLQVKVREALSGLNIPKYVEEEVCKLVLKARRAGILRGRGVRIVAAAALMHISKSYPAVQVSPSDVERVSGADLKRVYRCYRLLLVRGVLEEPKAVRRTRPSYVVASLAGKPGLKEVVTRHGVPIGVVAQFADAIAERMQGRKPAGVAAAAFYLVLKMMNVRKTQAEVAKSAGVSPLTLRRLIKQIPAQLEIVIKI
mgnify:CR=1 FL=1